MTQQSIKSRRHTANDERHNRVHIVQEDESLSVIAREFYGNPSLWNHIFEANQDRMESPNNIRAGQELIIPELKK